MDSGAIGIFLDSDLLGFGRGPEVGSGAADDCRVVVVALWLSCVVLVVNLLFLCILPNATVGSCEDLKLEIRNPNYMVQTWIWKDPLTDTCERRVQALVFT